MNRSTILSICGVAVTSLIVGVALGSTILAQNGSPSTLTKTTTVTTMTEELGNSTYPVVTVTLETIFVYAEVPYCTTVSGTTTVAYSQAVGGYTTTTYLYPSGHLNSSFLATVTTAYPVGASFQTESSSVSC